eukprot:2471572-Prymnesium_polylepis.1
MRARWAWSNAWAARITSGGSGWSACSGGRMSRAGCVCVSSCTLLGLRTTSSLIGTFGGGSAAGADGMEEG